MFALAGSRQISASGATLVIQIAANLAASGASLVVGCCSGADSAVLSAVPGVIPPSMVQCLAAFGSDGVGAGSASAVAGVSAFAAAGGAVQWWAGGSVAMPLRCRLAARTRSVVAAADAGLVVFFSSPDSRGSLLACRCAVSRGLPVVAFPIAFDAAQLPLLGVGYWLAQGLSGSFLWQANQHDIFT